MCTDTWISLSEAIDNVLAGLSQSLAGESNVIYLVEYRRRLCGNELGETHAAPNGLGCSVSPFTNMTLCAGIMGQKS